VRVLERRVRSPWGSEAAEVVRLVYDEGVAGVVTAPDRAASHLAAQVAAKARIPVIVLAGAGALTRIPLPWVLRGVPDEEDAIGALLAAAPAGPAPRRVVPFVRADREGERLAEAIARAAARAGWTAADPVPCGPAGEGRASGIGAARSAPAAAVLVALPAGAAVPVLRDLRAARFAGAVLALPEGDPAEIARAAGEAGEGALLPRLLDPASSGEPAGFRAEYRRRFGGEPGDAAAAAHDAVRALARAARAAGGSADAVLEALVGAAPLPGATGLLSFAAAGTRRGPVPLAVVRGGTLVPLAHPTEERR
jgi:branched-chain amino acid transport system substrate-binding protein